MTVASLNNLEIKAADISNAFLSAPCAEHVCFRAGPEFGDKEGQWVKVVRNLYGLVSASASFARHRNEVLANMGFVPCEADPDVWMRRSLRKSALNRFNAHKAQEKAQYSRGQSTKVDNSDFFTVDDYYYEYICTYVDDILAISEDPDAIMQTISKPYTLKDVKGTGEKWETPTSYLGADVGYYRKDKIWVMGAQTYIDGAIKNLQLKLSKRNLELQKTAKQPFPQFLDGSFE